MKKKLLSLIFCICFIAPAIFIFSACSDGNPAFVNKSEWEASFAYNQKVVITQISQYSGAITTYKDGFKIKKETQTSQTQYFDFDGTKYWCYSFSNNTWAKTEITKQTYDYETMNFSTFLKYDDFTFDQNGGIFKANNVIYNSIVYSNIAISFANKKPKNIEMTIAGFKITITFDYDKSLDIKLPSINPWTVSESEWEQALEYTDTVHVVKTINGEQYEQFYQKDGLVKNDYGSGAIYTETDGTNWWRYFEGDYGVEKEESDKLNCYIYGFSNFVGLFGLDYWYDFYEFDEEQKSYIYEDEDQKITIKFVDKKFSKITIWELENSLGEDETETIMTFDYSGAFTITLPEVTIN